MKRKATAAGVHRLQIHGEEAFVELSTMSSDSMLTTPTPVKNIYRAPAMTRSFTKEHRMDVKVKQHMDTLYKDIEQKEKKLLRMNKEVQLIRNDYASQSRELKMLKNVFEKVIAEKSHLSIELNASKQYNRKLETCLERLEDPQKMIDEISNLHSRLEVHLEELDESNRALKDRDNTIVGLKQDVEILKRTLDVRTDHEARQHNGIGKEAMRSLYFELGKRQADTHSLSLSLSECNQELNTYKAKAEGLGEEVKRLGETLSRKQSDNDILSRQSIADKEEIDSLRLKISAAKDVNQRQAREIQELKGQLQKEQKQVEESQNDTIEIVSKISGELEREKQEKNAVLLALEAHRNGTDGSTAITMNAALSTEMESLRSKNSDLEALVNQLRNELCSMSSSSLHVNPNSSCSEYEFHISELNRKLQKTTASLEEATTNGESMQERYTEEKEKNKQLKLRIIELENAVNELKESKDVISSTILDSLHKEKEKNSKLENILQTRSPLSGSSSSYNVVDADIFDEEQHLDNHSLTAVSPSEATLAQTALTTTSNGHSLSSSLGTGDTSPKLSMLEELRRMREELRRIEEAGPILSPVSSNTTAYSTLSGEQRSDVNSDDGMNGNRKQNFTDDIEFQRIKAPIDKSNCSVTASSYSDAITETAADLDDSKV